MFDLERLKKVAKKANEDQRELMREYKKKNPKPMSYEDYCMKHPDQVKESSYKTPADEKDVPDWILKMRKNPPGIKGETVNF